jgi:hypothetical protein
MRISVSKEDLLRGKTVAPGWYTCTIRNIEQEKAKTDGSLNTKIMFTIEDSGAYQGIPIDKTFNEKGAGFAKPFLEALLGRKLKEDGEDIDLDPARIKGRKMRVYIKNGSYQNRLTNQAEDFQPVA